MPCATRRSPPSRHASVPGGVATSDASRRLVISSRSSTTGCATATSAVSPPPPTRRDVGHGHDATRDRHDPPVRCGRHLIELVVVVSARLHDHPRWGRDEGMPRHPTSGLPAPRSHEDRSQVDRAPTRRRPRNAPTGKGNRPRPEAGPRPSSRPRDITTRRRQGQALGRPAAGLDPGSRNQQLADPRTGVGTPAPDRSRPRSGPTARTSLAGGNHTG